MTDRDRAAAMAAYARLHAGMVDPEPVITFDGLDAAIVGTVRVHGELEDRIVYDRDLIIDLLAARSESDGADPADAYEDAVEWFDHNVGCLYAGPGTPAILTRWGTDT